MNFSRRVYPGSFGQMEGIPTNSIDMRSRLLGFDTHEAPRGPGRRDCRVPQPLWSEGRQFLQQELHELRGDRSMTQESSVTVMVLTSTTGYCWTFVASTMQKRDQREFSLFQLYKGLRWPKKHYAQDMPFRQITILSQMSCGKNFRRPFDKEEAVSPESSLFTPLFAGGNDTGRTRTLT